jgi:NADH:ubiquinone oxidoreductase subunit
MEIPTDWSFWILYNPSSTPGKFTIRTWVEELTDADEAQIKDYWQPTGVSVSAEKERLKLQEEEVARQKEIIESL